MHRGRPKGLEASGSWPAPGAASPRALVFWVVHILSLAANSAHCFLEATGSLHWLLGK